MAKAPNTPPPGAPVGWQSGAQTVVARTHDLSRSARGIAATTMRGNDLVQEQALITMKPDKP